MTINEKALLLQIVFPVLCAVVGFVCGYGVSQTVHQFREDLKNLNRKKGENNVNRSYH